jgi:hypothetical protein
MKKDLDSRTRPKFSSASTDIGFCIQMTPFFMTASQFAALRQYVQDRTHRPCR